ncbi:MAG: phosphotransferase [Cognatishimia sp.]|uniref:aminoglycoside phosphotransferase family protein n=1 Tax=Cognatishimia sp. TaxID=2211648 RepID=UPI003B8B11A6
MTDRATLLTSFLASSGFLEVERKNLAGDASNRRYERLHLADGSTRVLMDAPPSKGEDIRPFVNIARHLQSLNLSAPAILAEDAANGFLILEDLGDDLFARVVQADPSLETQLYQAAADVLVTLHQAPAPSDLLSYSPKVMAEMAAHAWRWYRRGCGLEFEQSAQNFESKFETILAQNVPECDVLIQRDYHAENLLWLPDRNGQARVGLLDFQDAMSGHRAYDLVSMLQDARRDVSPDIEREMIAYYIQQTGQNADDFDAAYHLLGLQRNLRILGIFARLSMHFNKPHYVDFIPRVWGFIERDLAHSVSARVRDLIATDLPAPTPEILQSLRDQCGTVPTL